MTKGDQVSVSVLVAVPRADAFRVFTEEIDEWWRRGMAYRLGKGRSVLYLEPRVGGRLYERFESKSGAEKVIDTGRVTVWEPPVKLAFEWRAVNFAPDEKTEVVVEFVEKPSGTLVTVVHRGWSRIRADHPVRHGEEVAAFIRSMGRWWGDLMTSLRERVSPGREGGP